MPQREESTARRTRARPEADGHSSATIVAPRSWSVDHGERFVVPERLGVDESRALRYEQQAERSGKDSPCSGGLAGPRGAIRGRAGVLRFELDVVERGG
jgi:hypothetical protein